MLNSQLQLPDGRTLGYAIYGPGDGQPVLYFHGSPSSRLEPLLLPPYGIDLQKLLQKNSIKLIAIDRPGNGLSSINPNGTFLSFADDAIYLLNHLGISAAKVVCWSGGGPFALAVASKYKQQISGIFIIAGFTASFSDPHVFKNMHLNKFYFGTARELPGLVRLGMIYLYRKEIRKPLPRVLMGLPKVDHDLMKDPEKFENLAAVSLKQACYNGSKGPVFEAGMYFNNFNFSLEAITQPVHFWWGSEDTNVTSIHPLTLKKHLPQSIIHFKKGEGHLSIYIKYFEEVLRTIAAD